MKSKERNRVLEYEVLENEGMFVVQEKGTKYKTNLRSRLLNFSIAVLKFLIGLPQKRELDVIKYQLSKSATSIGANYEESQTATYNEFIQRIRISLREANETIYWLKIIDALNLGSTENRIKLINEADQIGKILGSIVSKANQRK